MFFDKSARMTSAISQLEQKQVIFPPVEKDQQIGDHINVCSYHMVEITLPAR